MKKVLLSILVMGVILVGACGTTTTPSTGTQPDTEPEEAPDYTSWIAWQLKELNQAMIQLVSEDSDYVIRTRVYSEEEGEVLVHEFAVPAGGGGWWWTFPVPAFYFQEAKTHINNAYWLTNEGKLSGEVWARDVSPDEVAEEVSEALDLLKLQVEFSYSWQEDNIQWITESTSPSPGLPPNIQVNKETTIQNLAKVYDDYREELSEVISKLELILSRLSSTTNAES